LGHGDPPAAFKPVGREAAQRAEKLYDLGTWHRVRGEHALAMQRFREALKLDPDLLKAQCDLAGLLFLRGEHKAVERHYQHVLSRDPRHLTALKGLALLQARQRSYASARQTLQRLLLVSPEDAEAWLHLGDVTMFTGDRQAAREAWKKAGAIDNASAKVKQRAESRLTIYQGERVP
jgi:tetratricopeptide (TPR) repeat protein